MASSRSVLIPLLLVACEGASPVAAVRSNLRRAIACVRSDEAPLRSDGTADALSCTSLGARDLSPAVPAGSLHVVAGAQPGGDGSEARPYATIAEAYLSRFDAAVIVLSPGVHAVRDFSVTRSLTLIGAGPGTTALSGASSGPVISVRGASLTLTALSLRRDDGAVAQAPLLSVDASSCALRDVRMQGGLDGVQARRSAVTGARVTVADASRYGVFLEDGALALEDFIVRGAGAQGIRLVRGHFDLRVGAVVGSGRHGLVATGAAPSLGGRADCTTVGGTGALDCVTRVSVISNHVAGMFFEDLAVVELREVLAAGTRFGDVSGGRAGDGVVVQRATARFDPEAPAGASRGVASAAIDNDRVGVLAQGEGTSIDVRGALMAGNRGGGIVVTSRASLASLRDSLLEGNQVGGLLLTPGVEAGVVQCNGISDNAEGALETVAGPIVLGDGVHVNGVRGALTLVDNEISLSGRFGLLVNGSEVSAQRNVGSGNRYGVGVDAGAMLRGALGAILGDRDAPSAPPSLLEGL
jgi:hypothetical protein